MEPIENALERVSSIDGIYFNYKVEPIENREVGVIAQVEKFRPLVAEESNFCIVAMVSSWK